MKTIIKSLLLTIVFAAMVFAQQGKDKEDAVQTAVSKLQQKVLLTDDQASKVKNIITSNLKELQNSATQSKALDISKTKVEGLLDARQKAKYSIVKDDWWNSLVKNL